MWIYRIKQSLKLGPRQKYISFVGAGGKTSLAEHMAAELLKEGRSVAITTTTKIYVKDPYCLIDEDFSPGAGRPFVRVGSSVEEGKLTALSFEDLERLGDAYDVVLVEADGAKGMPLKFPAIHEPVIPPFSDKIFVVAGLDGLFGRVDHKVFRWEIFCNVTGIGADALVTPEIFLRFFHGDTLLKGVDREKCAVILNKYDTPGARREATDIAKGIIAGADVGEVIISSTLFKVFHEIKALS
jgi:probable selenium-dependent hydroxylase accessory protein YqeC